MNLFRSRAVTDAAASAGVIALAAAAVVAGCGQQTGASSGAGVTNNVPVVGTNVVERPQAQAKEGDAMKEHRSGEWTPGLEAAEKVTLFAIARDTLEWSVKGRAGKFQMERHTITPKLKEPCATFVTFKNKDMLRGCMGCLEAVEPMYMSVHRSAANASRDFRFADDPISADEMPQIEIHVSLLSPRREIPSLDQFVVGKHGIWFEKAGRGAVFLPEVAIEQKWTKEDTLSHLAMKAGLNADAWRSGATFMVFESVVLAER